MKTELSKRLTTSILNRLKEFAIKHLKKVSYEVMKDICKITDDTFPRILFLYQLDARYVMKTEGEEVDFFCLF
jgi:hypothetical protein